jgi:hypothetical protein
LEEAAELGLGVGSGDAAEGFEGEGPVHFIGDAHPFVFRGEQVPVAPEGEGTVGSGVDEFVRVLDVSDFRDP